MFTFFRRHFPHAAVSRDADRLIASFGHGAYEMAGAMSWREDTGLLHQPEQGHWHRVQLEIGRRTTAAGSAEMAEPQAAILRFPALVGS